MAKKIKVTQADVDFVFEQVPEVDEIIETIYGMIADDKNKWRVPILLEAIETLKKCK